MPGVVAASSRAVAPYRAKTLKCEILSTIEGHLIVEQVYLQVPNCCQQSFIHSEHCCASSRQTGFDCEVSWGSTLPENITMKLGDCHKCNFITQRRKRIIFSCSNPHIFPFGITSLGCFNMCSPCARWALGTECPVNSLMTLEDFHLTMWNQNPT